MKQVKGPWIQDYVKMVKSFLKDSPEKKAEFEELLETKDWDIINSFVVPTEYYDYDSFQRIGRAVFIVIAQSNLQAVQAYGGIMIEYLLKFYKRVLVEEEPIETLQRFIGFHTSYFQAVDSHTEMMYCSETNAIIKLKLVDSDKQYPEASKAFAYQLAGSFVKLAELAGAKNIQIKIQEDHGGNYVYNISWD